LRVREFQAGRIVYRDAGTGIRKASRSKMTTSWSISENLRPERDPKVASLVNLQKILLQAIHFVLSDIDCKLSRSATRGRRSLAGQWSKLPRAIIAPFVPATAGNIRGRACV
jgi:hypothetical protein